jgi:DNA primase large subunit
MDLSKKTKEVRVLFRKQFANAQEDEASHFILRLSYCQSEELRRWLLQQEASLLKYRLASRPGNAASLVQLEPISEDRKEQLRSQLSQLLSLNDMKRPVYGVPFTEALDLVASRRCVVHGGYAYLGQNQLETFVVQEFRTRLSQHLIWPDDPEIRRIFPLLKNMHTTVTQSETTLLEGVTGLSPQAIPTLKSHMPLCMRQLQTGLERDHKLKFWGRMQYGRFLKGAGLSMDDALLFFQHQFSAVVNADQFQKQYAYHIRHMYGKEGQRKSYTPYNCAKIIQGNPPPNAGDHHGCPFHHYDANHLSTLLRQLQIGTEADRRELVQLASHDRHTQLACLRHFEIMHPGDKTMDNVGNHPNAWFRASMEWSGGHSINNKMVEKSSVERDSTTQPTMTS